ncbi:MAG: hypothetical protein Q9216_002078 [Gyalolechia sp. 2 TL-2023]
MAEDWPRASLLDDKASNHSTVPLFNDGSIPKRGLVRRISRDETKDRVSEIKREIRRKESLTERVVAFNEKLQRSDPYDQEQIIWRLLDAYDFRKDLSFWLELANVRQRLNGVEGIRLIWKAIRTGGLGLPAVGASADALWTQLLRLGFEDAEILKEVFIYARQQKEASSQTWSKLYAAVLCHHIQKVPGKVWICHMRLYKHFPPTSHQFQQLLRFSLHDENLRQIYLRMHESFPYIRLYDFAIPQLCRQGLYATATTWHEKLIRRGDYPSDARQAEPVLRYLALNGDKNRLMEYTRLMVEAGVSFAAYRDKDIRLPSFISRDIVRPPLGHVEEIPEKKFSDGFCARLFATKVFSLDTVINSLVFLGVQEIGPQALREMASREIFHDPYHLALQARLDQLREVGILTDDSVFCVVVCKLVAEEKDHLLRNVISCDLHSDTFEDHELQESLLPHYQEQCDTTAFTRTIMILTAKVPERLLETKQLNYVLRAFLTRRDIPGVMRTIDKMREQHIQLETKSTMHMRKTMLSHRNIGRRPATTEELDLLIRIWQDVLCSDGFIPPNAWTEILRRLGMSGRLLAFERLALWLAAWYSSPEFRASQTCNSFGKYRKSAFPHPLMSIDLKPSNHLHPLSILFPRSLQQGIIAWGFQCSPSSQDRGQGRPDWTWGLSLLRKLREANVHVLTPVVAKAFKLRLLTMFGHDSTATVENMVAKAKGYGKKGRENIAIQFDRLQLSSPNKYQPLVEVDSNQQQRPRQPTPKKKAKINRRHRQSITFTAGNEIDRAEIDKPTKKYLNPLFTLTEVNPSVSVFSDWTRVWSTHCDFTKIAQGSYGAVFRIQSKAQPGTFTIGKLIPLQARTGWGSKSKEFTTIGAARNEVALLAAFDQLHGFVQFRKAEVLQGCLPTALELPSVVFDATQEEDDISPRWIGACSNPTQLWLFLEMSDAGTDLETVLTKNLPHNPIDTLRDRKRYIPAVQVRDIFWQVASALALAEKKFTFEHRDLHLGNICLTRHREPPADDSRELWTSTPIVLVTIIDYTLSRAIIDPQDEEARPLFNDLSKDPVLFEGTGAGQYDVYRQMRLVLKDDWDQFEPLTNVYWLSHLLDLLMERKPEGRQSSLDTELWNRLADLNDCLTDDKEKRFSSAQDVVRYCEGDAAKGKK